MAYINVLQLRLLSSGTEASKGREIVEPQHLQARRLSVPLFCYYLCTCPLQKRIRYRHPILAACFLGFIFNTYV